MQTTLVSFVILLSLQITSSKFCTCEIQVSQATCPEQCYWENNKCSSIQTNCTSASNCNGPKCFLNTTNNTCGPTPACAQITNVSPSICLQQNCFPVNQSASTTNCTTAQGCSSITVQNLCQGQTSATNANAACFWNTATNKCADSTDCSTVPLNECSELCELNAQQTSCQQVDCTRRTSTNCTSDETGSALCQLTSSTTPKCVTKQCLAINGLTNCTNSLNQAACYWTGNSCQNCFINFSNILYVSVSVIYMTLLIILQ